QAARIPDNTAGSSALARQGQVPKQVPGANHLGLPGIDGRAAKRCVRVGVIHPVAKALLDIGWKLDESQGVMQRMDILVPKRQLYLVGVLDEGSVQPDGDFGDDHALRVVD